MKRILLGFIVYLCIASNGIAQTDINFDSCYKFINSSINNLNIQLYEGILDKKIKGYSNDSLASEKSLEELVRYYEYVATIQNPSNPGDPYDFIDTVVVVPFNPKTDFDGASLFYERIIDVNTYTSSFRLWSYAGTNDLKVAGTSLGSIPRFQVAAKDVLSNAKHEDSTFFQGLLNQRTIHADYTNPYYQHDHKPLDFAQAAISSSVFGGHYWQRCNPSTDSIMAWYNFQLFTAIANKHWMEGGKLYKDVKLKQAHSPFFDDLSFPYTTQILDLNNWDHPNDLIDTTIIVSFRFDNYYEMVVTPNGKDFVVGLMVSDFDGAPLGRIYYSFNEVSKYALPSDQVVMRRLLESEK